jgi:hypothetical protein
MAGQKKREEMVESTKIGVGEGATGIEPENALKQGAQRQQTHQDVRQATHVQIKFIALPKSKSALKARNNPAN